VSEKQKPIPNYWPEQMDYVALESYTREEKEGYSILKFEFRVPKYFKFKSKLDVLELVGQMCLPAELSKIVTKSLSSRWIQE